MKPPRSTSTPERRAGRPREFDRNKALSLALELFWQHGFEGTSTAMLTSAMGIAQTSLYAAFGSKEDLYRQAVDLYLAQFGDFLTEPLAKETTARDAIEAVLMGAAHQFTQRGHARGCMVSCAELQTSPSSAAMVQLMSNLRAQARQAIETRLNEARATGEIALTTDTKHFAAYYAMVIQGMAVQARDGATESMLRTLAGIAMMAWPGATP